MNLAATIDLYLGGPGSGCHGDKCGRPRTADYDKYWDLHPKSVELLDKGQGEIKYLPISKIKEHDKTDAEQVKDMTKLMKGGYKFNMILVAPSLQKKGNYVIVDGHHRFRSYKKATGNTAIHVIVTTAYGYMD